MFLSTSAAGTSTGKFLRAAVLGGLTAILFAAPSYAVDAPATATATASTTGSAAPRTEKEIMTDMKNAVEDLHAIMLPVDQLIDPDKRKEVAPKAIPVMQHMVQLMDELADSNKDMVGEVHDNEYQMLTILSLLGDAQSDARLQKDAVGADKSTALAAQLSLDLAAYWKSGKDEAGQNKVLDDVQKIGKANPDNDTVTEALQAMVDIGAATPAVSKRANDIVLTDLTGPMAKKMQSAPQVDQPFKWDAVDINGNKISSESLKGKVVIVDFWATWCGPCRSEIPDMIKFYQKYHDKGLEIVGVSADNDVSDLKKYLADNKDMSWAEIYDEEQPLIKKFSVEAFPTKFIVGRDGKLKKMIEGAGIMDQLEDLVPKLLDEKTAEKK